MASDTLSADQSSTADEAFEDFDLTEDQVEEAVDSDDDEVATGDETLEDEEAPTEDEAVVDEGEGAEARTDAAPQGRQRDAKTGKFLKPGETAATGGAETAEAAKPPKWDKLSVTVDKGLHAIDEAVVTTQGDHHIIAIKSTDFPRFQQRMQRGVQADRLWRQLNDGISELEEQRTLAKDAPQPKSDKQIEAETVLEFLAEKLTDEQGQPTGQTRLSQVVTPQELKWLGDRVKRMQLEHKEEFTKTHGEFVAKRQEERAKATESAGDGEQQLRGMASLVFQMASDKSEYPQEVKDLFRDATPDELKAIYAELVPRRQRIYWKEGKEWFADTQFIFDIAKQKLSQLRGGATPRKGTPASKTDPKTARAERLNKGHTSTSLKTKRTPLRPSAEEHPRSPAPKQTKTKAQAAEDRYRDTTRAYMNSPGFDLDDDEETEE